MEDQEPDDEGHTVGREVHRLGEDHLLGPVQPQHSRLMSGQLARACQRDPDAERYADERQRLLEQVRPALPLPGPPADQVAHESTGEPARRPGQPGSDVQQLADEVRELGGAKCQHRGGRKPDQAPSTPAVQQPPQRPGNGAPHAIGDSGQAPGWRSVLHARPQVIDVLGSIEHGIQYGNVQRPGGQRNLRQIYRPSPASRDNPQARTYPRGDPAQLAQQPRQLRAVRIPHSVVRGIKAVVTDKAGARS
jgi:hypothetical protein